MSVSRARSCGSAVRTHAAPPAPRAFSCLHYSYIRAFQLVDVCMCMHVVMRVAARTSTALSVPSHARPREGDCLRCQACGLQLRVKTKACGSKGGRQLRQCLGCSLWHGPRTRE